MSLSSLSLSVERRNRHPYRSLYAEMLFQSFHDALTGGEEVSTAAQEFVEVSPSAEGEEKRMHQDSRRKQHAPDAQLSNGGCPQQ